MASSAVVSDESRAGPGLDSRLPDDTQRQTTKEASTNLSTTENYQYPSGLRLVLILLSIFLSLFLVSLDRLIVSTAIPKITDEFHSLQDVGWYGSAYMLTTCSFQLLFGKLYKFYPVRLVFVTTIVFFEAGSAICGAAPSSVVLIIGRAIQGVGAAGIFSGVIVVIVSAVPLHRRPLYQGLFGAVFGISSVIGPLVGGAFTSSGATWRWCFYLNIPLGAIALLVIGFLLKVPDGESTKLSSRTKLPQLDAAGTAVLIPGVVCLLLALQWGGLTYEWNNGRIIALLTLGIALLLSFILVQAFMPATATIPPRIIKQRSIAAGFWQTICVGSQMVVFVYYLPIWFQAVNGVSAVDSGLYLLPLTLSMVIASISNGILVSKIGYYTPTSVLGACIMSIGAGLLTTLQLDTSRARWIGYQVVYGFGLGMCFQTSNLAAQTVLPREDVPIGSSLMFFSQLLGGSIFTSVGENVLNNQLLQRLSSLPGFQPSMIEDNGATTLRTSLSPELLYPVLVAYNDSLREVFIIGLVLSCLTIIGSGGLEWRSVKKQSSGTGKSSEAERGNLEGGENKVETGSAANADVDRRGPVDEK